MNVWRYYGEILVLVTLAFLVGSALAAVAVRVVVRRDREGVLAPASPATDEAGESS